VAGGKRTAADLGAWLVFEDESGQGLKPPKGRTWGRRGEAPVVTVTGGSSKRVSLAALIAVKPGRGPGLIYRVHSHRRGKKRKQGLHRKGVRPAAGHRPRPARRARRPSGDNLNAHVSGVMAELVAARDWLMVYRLPPYAHDLNPVKPVWSVLKDPWPTWSNTTSAS
jgi:putative transposase